MHVALSLLILISTSLSIYDHIGNRLAVSDDVGEGLCSGIAIILPEGNYYIVVTSYAAGSSGSYSLIGCMYYSPDILLMPPVKDGEGDIFFGATSCPDNSRIICPVGTGTW